MAMSGLAGRGGGGGGGGEGLPLLPVDSERSMEPPPFFLRGVLGGLTTTGTAPPSVKRMSVVDSPPTALFRSSSSSRLPVS